MHQCVTVCHRKRWQKTDTAQCSFIVELCHEHGAEIFELWIWLPLRWAHGIVCSAYIKAGKLPLCCSNKYSRSVKGIWEKHIFSLHIFCNIWLKSIFLKYMCTEDFENSLCEYILKITKLFLMFCSAACSWQTSDTDHMPLKREVPRAKYPHENRLEILTFSRSLSLACYILARCRSR